MTIGLVRLRERFPLASSLPRPGPLPTASPSNKTPLPRAASTCETRTHLLRSATLAIVLTLFAAVSARGLDSAVGTKKRGERSSGGDRARPFCGGATHVLPAGAAAIALAHHRHPLLGALAPPEAAHSLRALLVTLTGARLGAGGGGVAVVLAAPERGGVAWLLDGHASVLAGPWRLPALPSQFGFAFSK